MGSSSVLIAVNAVIAFFDLIVKVITKIKRGIL